MGFAIRYMNFPENELAHAYYSALNFRDIMLATGKISQRTAKGIFFKPIDISFISLKIDFNKGICKVKLYKHSKQHKTVGLR